MKLNTRPTAQTAQTHGGATVYQASPIEQLRRTVSACLLWEDSFYEEGQSVADRIAELVKQCNPHEVAELALFARSDLKLRHVPLLLVRELARDSSKMSVEHVLADVIKRPDEITEFMAIYWKDNPDAPLANAVKRGLRRAFSKFDEYQLAKYDRKGVISLRDVAFLVHPSPSNIEALGLDSTRVTPVARSNYARGSVLRHQDALITKLIESKLQVPATWEVALSAGVDARAAFTTLLQEGRLGYMALLRNLRKMVTAKVPTDLVERAILARHGAGGVLPFEFIKAGDHAPQYRPVLERALLDSLRELPRLPGRTHIVVDVSGSMYGTPVSKKSSTTRAEAACALAMMLSEVCERATVYATGGNDGLHKHKTVRIVSGNRGTALANEIYGMQRPLGGGGIFLTQVMDHVVDDAEWHGEPIDRVIVITDEQDCGVTAADHPSKAKRPGLHNYILNVGTYANGVGYKTGWVHVSGFSEASITYIAGYERLVKQQ